jgi:List-Bact-rpt repeat protein
VKGVLLALGLLLVLTLGVGSADGRTLVTTTVTVQVIGDGTVTSTPAGITCATGNAGTCTAAFTDPPGGVIVLTATPAAGSTFGSWACAGTGEVVFGSTCQIQGDGGTHNVTATFSPSAPGTGSASGTVAVSVIGKGRVTSTPGGIKCGDGKTTCQRIFSAGGSLTASNTAGSWAFGSWNDWDLTTGAPGPCDGSTSSTCTISDADAHQITANFSGPLAPTRTLSVGVTGNGTVTGGNDEIDCGSATTNCTWDVPAGSTLTVLETPDPGNIFSGWGGSCSGTGVSCTVEMGDNKFAGATFVDASTALLTIAVKGAGNVHGPGISCSGPGTCSQGEPLNSTITITAEAAGGYLFSGWTGGGCDGLGTTCMITMDAAKTVTATFAPVLSVTLNGNGSVTAVGGAINCGNGATICSAPFAQNASVTLTATPSLGATFAGWSGACGGTVTTCTVLMSTAKEVSATFIGGTAPAPGGTTGFTLTTTVIGNGTVTGGGINCGTGGTICSSPNHVAGSTVTLTAIPSGGATFGGWGGACIGTTPTCIVLMTSAKSVTATFLGGTATFQLSVSVSGAGAVTGGGINCGSGGSTCTASEIAGTVVTLTATPGPGATFTSWGGSCAGSAKTCTVTITTATTVTAAFASGGTAGTLTLLVSGRGTVSTSLGRCAASGPQRTCVQHFRAGARVTLTATPLAGASFLGWGGSCAGTRRTCTVTLSAARSVTARFSGAPTPTPTTHAVLASLGLPIVKRAGRGFRVTLRFSTTAAGLARVRGLRAGRVAASLSLRVAAGRATIGPFPVAKTGLYTFEVRLAGRTIHWRTCLGRCGAAAPRPNFVLTREAPTVTRSGDVWSVTLHLRANLISAARVRAYRAKKLLVDRRFLGRTGEIIVGPFLLGPGSYTLRLTAVDAYGRVRTLTWIVALAR